jgi:hypothetical protein
VKLHRVFHTGFATNVGGTKPPKRGTSDGWHIAAARGLPDRIITSVVPDPGDPKTVYVTLGISGARYFAPIGSLGEDTSTAGGGHVYKSTDAGETFHDISGDLPDVQATWALVRDGQLIVGTAIGAYASRGTNGGDYAPLGKDLPAVAIYSMQLKPGDPNTLVAATYGRGDYTYRFANPRGVGAGQAGCGDHIRPVSHVSRKAAKASRTGRLRLRGSSSDRGCGPKGRGKVKRVRISVARASGKKCRYLNRKGHLGKLRSCKRTVYLAARGTKHWRFTGRRNLARGKYKIWIRAVDTAGNVEKKNRKRNYVALRVR